ncbi:HMT1 (YBR034C) [Zygosaccharomyces parabailii]|uniref:ZYBA0S03-08086g1_1 n=1 Tax=Zygosaccharomyces bailii (strain CLIB 213 / ATCC 58445 / CBS 680 / BCRC 21525 / NBRC 1098 / NCYC 1416 / NRRL Y-2227) TaxID=1333698 RepID=A0A8J2X7E2_ZYGB2|nr:HMT1 (YBR034C) [Zygosaccharomyces parabailii]CDF89054.1 ZYBA0S03-08086g1_1 [Zygosaccharomyces bailii CLIB 213]CDH16138.1 probable HMT1-HnRNP arginine N-methyltransferase [Zygosaccharomyces bailii ISA1307]SJM83242.1 probable HNRNP arginine N-methyltransferase [Zygosaccharomyces bailii]
MESATEKSNLTHSEQHYFNSYDHYGIHEEMLQDSVRTLSYRNAIAQNKDFFKDKIVLDVGCGTGILSMFAAKHGAKHVIGVDMSSIIEMAKKLVEKNGFSDKITLLRGKLEDVQLPFPKVDIIVSEWMGYFLLYESMLDTVLYARDHYLVKGGLIFPDKCSLHIAGLEDAQYKDDKVNYWHDVYGFDFSPFIPLVMREPIVDTVESQVVNTTRCKLIEFDLNTVQLSDLSFTAKFQLQAKRQDWINGVITWFDVEFPAPKGQRPIQFSTGAHAPYTHWKQSVFYTADDLECEAGDILEGEITCSPNKFHKRDLDIKLSYNFKAKGVDAARRCKKNTTYYIMH